MRASEAIFLSASVPDPLRSAEFAATADTVAITAAVSALLYVVLGRRALIWGGHPAITPMVWAVAEALNLDYSSWVSLYQSRRFQDEFPEDNRHFKNVTFTADVRGDREISLQHMRERMFKEHAFSAAVFIGGMGGVLDEFALFRKLQPNATVVPIASTGGAALQLAERESMLFADLVSDFDYVALLHRRLGVSQKELRYTRPDEQPAEQKDRLWSQTTRDGGFSP